MRAVCANLNKGRCALAKKDPTVQTPPTISYLLQPIQGPIADRRVWSIPLAGVWVPFFTAINATGETAMSAEALGAPLRLALDKDGTPRFSKSGRPVLRVVKELNDQVRIARDNFVNGLLSFTLAVKQGMPDAYKAQVAMAQKAGEPIVQKDMATLDAYIAATAPRGDGDGATPSVEPQKELVPA